MPTTELSVRPQSFSQAVGSAEDEAQFQDKAIKKASPKMVHTKVASATEAFFDNKEYLTEAQKRYPELLKVADGRSGDAPRPSFDLKKRPAAGTSPLNGTIPSQSPLSGGSA